MFPVVVPLAVIGLLMVGLSRLQRVVEVLRSQRFITVGWTVLVAIVLIALPSFLISVGDILGSSAGLQALVPLRGQARRARARRDP